MYIIRLRLWCPIAAEKFFGDHVALRLLNITE
jgi:hypothetical protein